VNPTATASVAATAATSVVVPRLAKGIQSKTPPPCGMSWRRCPRWPHYRRFGDAGIHGTGTRVDSRHEIITRLRWSNSRREFECARSRRRGSPRRVVDWWHRPSADGGMRTPWATPRSAESQPASMGIRRHPPDPDRGRSNGIAQISLCFVNGGRD
jgi:hypothetical protein